MRYAPRSVKINFARSDSSDCLKLDGTNKSTYREAIHVTLLRGADRDLLRLDFQQSIHRARRYSDFLRTTFCVNAISRALSSLMSWCTSALTDDPSRSFLTVPSICGGALSELVERQRDRRRSANDTMSERSL